VTARLRTGRLWINNQRCPNLAAEAKLYRYPSPSERALAGENPIDEHNHALGALRYLISRLDGRFLGKLRGKTNRDECAATQIKEKAAWERSLQDSSVYNEEAWATLERGFQGLLLKRGQIADLPSFGRFGDLPHLICRFLPIREPAQE